MNTVIIKGTTQYGDFKNIHENVTSISYSDNLIHIITEGNNIIYQMSDINSLVIA